jgi:hypothetical protein
MTYWKQIPKDESPEKEGRFFVMGGLCGRDTCDYSPEYGWSCTKDYFTHYLVPVTGEEIKKIASDVWDAAFKFYTFNPINGFSEKPNPHPNKTDYLKSIK